jgi:hypothetical protein
VNVLYSTCFIAHIDGRPYLAKATRLDVCSWRVDVFGLPDCYAFGDTRDGAAAAAVELASTLIHTHRAA